MSDKKLWLGTALTPSGNEYGAVVVLAETREEAVAKARPQLSDAGNHVPTQRYVQALLDNVANMREITDGVFIAWD
ncbi:hypothetical protein ACRU3B_10705 [Mycobacterium colombiense]